MGRKKKPKSANEVPFIEFELFFDDVTILESDGVYQRVKELMEEDIQQTGKLTKKQLDAYQWVVKSKLSIFSPFGQGNFILDFYWDKRVYIVGFATTTKDKYQNADVRCLSTWCQENGWKIPSAIQSIITDNLDFWTHMWKTNLIDSEFLDMRYGKRQHDYTVEDDEEDDYGPEPE